MLWTWESRQSLCGLCRRVGLSASPLQLWSPHRKDGAVESSTMGLTSSQATGSESQNKQLQRLDCQLTALCCYPEVEESAQKPRPGLPQCPSLLQRTFSRFRSSSPQRPSMAVSQPGSVEGCLSPDPAAVQLFTGVMNAWIEIHWARLNRGQYDFIQGEGTYAGNR